jgi:hypothetical protein
MIVASHETVSLQSGVMSSELQRGPSEHEMSFSSTTPMAGSQ